MKFCVCFQLSVFPLGKKKFACIYVFLNKNAKCLRCVKHNGHGTTTGKDHNKIGHWAPWAWGNMIMGHYGHGSTWAHCNMVTEQYGYGEIWAHSNVVLGQHEYGLLRGGFLAWRHGNGLIGWEQ